MSRRPWIEPSTTFISDPIVITTSKKGYFRWLASLIIALPITLWFYGLYSEIPSQKESQIALSLMIGLDVWLFSRIAELIRRRLSIGFSVISYRSLLNEEALDWANIKRIEWWYAARERVNFYRIRLDDNQPLATFGDDTWSRVSEGIGYAVARKRLEPILVTPHLSEFAQTAIVILMPLAVATFSFVEADVWRIIGFVVARIFWALLIWQHSRHELRTTQFYMVLLSITVIVSLMLVSGSSFQSTLIWWLYSPLIEALVSWVVVELYRLWKKKQIQLQTE